MTRVLGHFLREFCIAACINQILSKGYDRLKDKLSLQEGNNHAINRVPGTKYPKGVKEYTWEPMCKIDLKEIKQANCSIWNTFVLCWRNG